MKKDYIDELVEELLELKNSKKTINLPVPPAPHEVFEIFVRVTKNHHISADELRESFAFRELSKAERELLEELERKENND